MQTKLSAMRAALIACLVLAAAPAAADEAPRYTVPLGIAMDSWPYPYPAPS